MPLRLILIPSLVMVAALLGALASWHFAPGPQSKYIDFDKALGCESDTAVSRHGLEKAIAILHADQELIKAQDSMINSGLELFRWMLLLIALQMAFQIWMTYGWWKKTSNISVNKDAPKATLSRRPLP